MSDSDVEEEHMIASYRETLAENIKAQSETKYIARAIKDILRTVAML